ncbi:MAG: signal peptidase I [Oscillospiraceae bacterium]|nr:signal peptidase I [Oscillospiraceae bacterium]
MSRRKRTVESIKSEEVRGELNRIRNKSRFRNFIRTTLYTLIVVAAIAVLVATLWMPVLQTFGDSMSPTLEDGQIVVSLKTGEFKSGDVIAFYYNNKILIKRLIGVPGDWINIDEAGNVYVNGERLDEPYVDELAFGYCNIQLPYQVPDERYFVLGDHRSVSMDSRDSNVGCVATEQVVGSIVFRVWPLKDFGPLNSNREEPQTAEPLPSETSSN